MLRLSLGISPVVLDDIRLRERLLNKLENADTRAERLILEIPEPGFEVLERDTLGLFSELGVSMALGLSGLLPRQADRLPGYGLDFLVLPEDTANRMQTTGAAFVFGLLRQIADRAELGLVVPGIREIADGELVDELGADFLAGPAIGRRPAVIEPVA